MPLDVKVFVPSSESSGDLLEDFRCWGVVLTPSICICYLLLHVAV